LTPKEAGWISNRLTSSQGCCTPPNYKNFGFLDTAFVYRRASVLGRGCDCFDGLSSVSLGPRFVSFLYEQLRFFPAVPSVPLQSKGHSAE
jgi:hypothetical protein